MPTSALIVVILSLGVLVLVQSRPLGFGFRDNAAANSNTNVVDPSNVWSAKAAAFLSSIRRSKAIQAPDGTLKCRLANCELLTVEKPPEKLVDRLPASLLLAENSKHQQMSKGTLFNGALMGAMNRFISTFVQVLDQTKRQQMAQEGRRQV